VTGFTASVRRLTGGSPLADHVAVPVLRTAGPPRPGAVHCCVVCLAGAALDEPPAVAVAGDAVSVTWPDGVSTVLHLPAADPASPGPGGPGDSPAG
jgi:hypothetical protein